MKKRLFFFMLFLLILAAMPVYTQENIILNMNFGNVSVAGNIPNNDGYSLELSLTLMNIGIEHRQTKIGLEFSPFKTYFWPRIYEAENIYSFINMTLYWNTFNSNLSDGNFYFGPFASINSMFFSKDLDWDWYIFTAGAQLGFRIDFGNFNYNIFSVETGYRLIDGTGKYFIGGKIDIVALILFVLIIQAGDS
jgi:hypothetical protein